MDRLISFEQIRNRITTVRGQRVMMSHDLAELYGVASKVLVQSVRRNHARFPSDFMFQLTADEFQILRSQSVTSRSAGWGGSRYPPLAFTEHGVAMLSSVLRSQRAIEVNIQVVRAFVQLRQWLIGNRALARRVADLETKYDGHFKIVFEALQELMEPPAILPSRQIGFRQQR